MYMNMINEIALTMIYGNDVPNEGIKYTIRVPMIETIPPMIDISAGGMTRAAKK